jgi:predicted ATPase
VEVLGRYRLLRRLGGGAFGEVFEASVDGPLGERRVALKVLRRGGEGLLREARVAALLRHRHLVDVYEVDHDGDRWFCAMELCALGSLADHAPLPPRALVDVGLAVCAALGVAHGELGLVHLDLKPENLLLTADGTPKVGDLGLAREVGVVGRGVGTPLFMAPEQRRGGEVDGRADVFGLGRTLEALATGWDPGGVATFDPDATGEGAGALPTVPAWLRGVVARCTAVEPEERYPDLDAVAEALRALAPEGPGLADLPGVTAGGADREVVGRDALADAVLEALSGPGLTTLTGPVGVGKSAVAGLVADRYRGEVVLCDVRGVVDADALVAEVRSELLLGGDAPRDGVSVVAAALAGRRPAVLVLDDADHLDASALAAAARWARDVPVLATARSARGVEGERVIPVPPLDAADSASLFGRLAAARGVDLDAADPLVAQVVSRLDGLPFALALAAGRLGVIGLPELAQRLSVRWLRGGAAEGHGSFAEALDDDWSLLTGPEQDTLTELALFVTPFDEGAAAAVVTRPELVDRLIRRALVTVRGERRRLLGVVAEYAAARGASPAAEQRHGAWFLRPRPSLDRVERVRAARAVHADTWAAVERALRRGDGDLAGTGLRLLADDVRLVGGVTKLQALVAEVRALPGLSDGARIDCDLASAAALRFEGRSEEALRQVEAVWRHLEPGDPRSVVAAIGAGSAALALERIPEARRWFDEAVARARAVGQPSLVLRAEASLAWLVSERDGPDAGVPLYLRIVEAARALGDEAVELRASANLAVTWMRSGSPDRAEPLLARPLALAQQHEDGPALATAAGNLGVLAHNRGDTTAARGWYLAAERASRRAGQVGAAAWWRLNLAELALDDGRLASASRTLADDAALLESLGEVRPALHAWSALARVHAAAGRLPEAEAALRAIEALAPRVGARGRLRQTRAHAAVSVARGALTRGREQYREVVQLARAQGDRVAEALGWLELAESPGPWAEGERREVLAALRAQEARDPSGRTTRVLSALAQSGS